MVDQGLLTAEAAREHPDRNCLTSVILGGKVARIDCPKDPFSLRMGDVVVVSSDGLQYLENDRIQKVLHNIAVASLPRSLDIFSKRSMIWPIRTRTILASR